MNAQPNSITFSASSSTWVMRITADRRIEVNEGVEVNEAAKNVLDAMQHMLAPQRPWVGLTPQRPWVGLTDKHVFEVLENLQKSYHRPPSTAFAKAIEAKLKELNT